MTQAALQPHAETTAPTAIGPVTWPKLLPVIRRPIMTGTIAAERVAADAVASKVARDLRDRRQVRVETGAP